MGGLRSVWMGSKECPTGDSPLWYHLSCWKPSRWGVLLISFFSTHFSSASFYFLSLESSVLVSAMLDLPTFKSFSTCQCEMVGFSLLLPFGRVGLAVTCKCSCVSMVLWCLDCPLGRATLLCIWVGSPRPLFGTVVHISHGWAMCTNNLSSHLGQ